jgi:hypothetical protein
MQVSTPQASVLGRPFRHYHGDARRKGIYWGALLNPGGHVASLVFVAVLGCSVMDEVIIVDRFGWQSTFPVSGCNQSKLTPRPSM